MDRVIVGNADAGWKFFNNVLCRDALSYYNTKRQQLVDFGVPVPLIEQWELGQKDISLYGQQMQHLLVMLEPGMERMRPDGCTQLGLYAEAIGDVLAQTWSFATIMDFGCGPWVDASLYFAKRLKGPVVQLVDTCPMLLCFSSYQLEQHGIANNARLVTQDDDPSSFVTADTAMIVESTAFEHVVHIRHLFPKLMEALPSGAFFLTNYTRLDWTQPQFDGFQDNKDFAPDAVTAALDMAYRYEWEPGQTNWDLWERK